MLHIIHLPSHIHITRSIALSLYLSFVDLHRLCFKSYTRWHAQMVLKIGNVVWLILPSKWAAWMYVCVWLLFSSFFFPSIYMYVNWVFSNIHKTPSNNANEAKLQWHVYLMFTAKTNNPVEVQHTLIYRSLLHVRANFKNSFIKDFHQLIAVLCV